MLSQAPIFPRFPKHARCGRLPRHNLTSNCTLLNNLPSGIVYALDLLFIHLRWCGCLVEDGSPFHRGSGELYRGAAPDPTLRLCSTQHYGYENLGFTFK